MARWAREHPEAMARVASLPAKKGRAFVLAALSPDTKEQSDG